MPSSAQGRLGRAEAVPEKPRKGCRREREAMGRADKHRGRGTAALSVSGLCLGSRVSCVVSPLLSLSPPRALADGGEMPI
jgi:hypothetical protein